MDPDRWDKRYREGFYNGAEDPHELLLRFYRIIPGGPVIDIASGNGRDILFLAEKGFPVCGLERSGEALRIARKRVEEHALPALLVQGDASALPFPPGRAGAILVFYFLLRGIVDQMAGLLNKGGILFYETFLERQNSVDRRRNPEYLLRDGELYGFFHRFETLFYEETLTSAGGKMRAIARFVGRMK